jgi:prevent-host-death family protein
MTTMPASKARAALPEILDRVSAGEEVTITRHGQAIAVVISPQALLARRADEALARAERLRDALERGRAIRLDDAPTMTEERADDLVDDVRAARAAR